MTTKTLQTAVSQRPFRPFTLRLASGQRIRITDRDRVAVHPDAKTLFLFERDGGYRIIEFTSFDAGYWNGWDLASAMHPQTILAYGMNDNPLSGMHGAPLRLYAPTKLGYKMTKYLLGMTFTDRRPGGYWEDRGYPWFGGI